MDWLEAGRGRPHPARGAATRQGGVIPEFVPWVSLRSSPGYGLASLRDMAVRGIGLAKPTDLHLPNPEGWQKLAGGRSAAQTTGSPRKTIKTLKGSQHSHYQP